MNSRNSQRTARKPRVSRQPIPAYRETLSATAAKALRSASIVAVDYVFDDLSHLDDPDTTFDDGLLGMFYPQARLPRYTRAVARKLYLGIVLVGWQLAQDDQLLHASVAEELAGQALIETAKVQVDIEGRDADFSLFEEEFFEDVDFESLFDPANDGLMQAEIAEEMGLVNLEFADWCRPFGQRAIHPYLWPEEPVRNLPHVIAPDQTRDRLASDAIAQLRIALQVLPETEMTTGAAFSQLAPRERAALHIAAVQVLDQCFDDLVAAERYSLEGKEDGLATSLTLALLPEPFRKTLLAWNPYVRAKVYFCTLVAVCWKLAQREHMPLTSQVERVAAKVLCEAAARILALASEPDGATHLQTPSAAALSLLAAWQVIREDNGVLMYETIHELQDLASPAVFEAGSPERGRVKSELLCKLGSPIESGTHAD